MRTNGKCALVTGGTSGIGLELARCFAKDGYDLVLVAGDEAELRHTACELGIQHGVKETTIAKPQPASGKRTPDDADSRADI